MMKINIFILSIIASFTLFINQSNKAFAMTPEDSAYLILGAGAAGGVLGLSTLSFHDKPGDHLNNIIIGAAGGAIIGVALAMYFTMTDSTTFEEYTGSPPPPTKPNFKQNNKKKSDDDIKKSDEKKGEDEGNKLIYEEEEGYIPPKDSSSINNIKKFNTNSFNLPENTVFHVSLLQIKF